MQSCPCSSGKVSDAGIQVCEDLADEFPHRENCGIRACCVDTNVLLEALSLETKTELDEAVASGQVLFDRVVKQR